MCDRKPSKSRKCRSSSSSSSCDDEDRTPDFIIIGAGTAGLTAAWALTNKRHGKSLFSVLVIEAGENHNDDPRVKDPTLGSGTDLTYNPLFAYIRVTLQQQIYSDGFGVGGGSMHNGLQAVRGTPDLYDKWAIASGNPQWLYKNLLPLFKSQEHYTPDGTIADPNQRGLIGRLFITQEAPLTDSFSKAMSVGFNVPEIADYNDHFEILPGKFANTVGVSANQDWITPPPNSERSYSGNSYLYGIPSENIPPIVGKNGKGLKGRELKIVTSVKVSRIVFGCKNWKKAIGVEVIISSGKDGCCDRDCDRKTKIYYANKGVILAAGAIGSPALLQLSGIGAKSLLEPLGIKVIVDNPNVGKHLQNHYGPNALVRLLNPASPPPAFKLNVMFTDLHPFLPNDGKREIQSDFLYPGSIFFSQSLISSLGLSDIPSVSAGGLLLRPKSRGSVEIQSADPLTLPLLTLGNYTDELGPKPWEIVGSDAYKAVSYLKLIQEVAVAQGGGPADVLFPPNSAYPAPWGPAPDDSKLFDVAKSNTLDTFHCSATCKMGTSPIDSVVDGDLKVHGTKNLWVADCSIEPFVQDGNTAYAAYFIGLQLAKSLGANLP